MGRQGTRADNSDDPPEVPDESRTDAALWELGEVLADIAQNPEYSGIDHAKDKEKPTSNEGGPHNDSPPRK